MSQSREHVVAGLYAAFGRGDVPAVLSGIDEEIEYTSARVWMLRGGTPVRFDEYVDA